MATSNTNASQDSKAVLQNAIKQLEIFTYPEASSLEIGEDGSLKAGKETPLKRIISLAKSYVAPLLSGQIKDQQKKELNRLKNLILDARDKVMENSALIEACKNGDATERKFAEYAMTAIHRFNTVVSVVEEDLRLSNYHRQQLLLDPEIKGHVIELPRVVSIKFVSDGNAPAKRILDDLSLTFRIGATKKKKPSISSVNKKTDQFMLDSFRIKAIGEVKKALEPHALGEVIELIRQTDIEIEETPDFIHMSQLIEVGPGAIFFSTGSYERNFQPYESKFMVMPKLTFNMSSQITHTGFPYPSQHTGWVLGEEWVKVHPDRLDQVPLISKLKKKEKIIADKHLYDNEFIVKIRQLAKLKRECFNRNRDLFISLHKNIQKTLIGMFEEDYQEWNLEPFYQKVLHAPSAFDLFDKTQRYLMNLFLKKPIEELELKWLKGEEPVLRNGLPAEKLLLASKLLEQGRENSLKKLDRDNVEEAYIAQQGLLLGKAFQSVGLQYLSEKIGFAPPFLKDQERQLQACAFQQQMTFFDECDDLIEISDLNKIKESLLSAMLQDLKFLQGIYSEDEPYVFSLVDELEAYFTSRFFTRYH